MWGTHQDLSYKCGLNKTVGLPVCIFVKAYSFHNILVLWGSALQNHRSFGTTWTTSWTLSCGTKAHVFLFGETFYSSGVRSHCIQIQLWIEWILPILTVFMSRISCHGTRHSSFFGFWPQRAQWYCPWLWQNDCTGSDPITLPNFSVSKNQQLYRELLHVHEVFSASLTPKTASRRAFVIHKIVLHLPISLIVSK